ncbi:MAG TPA: TonB-dependent receptor [Caulobacteraceae bacterium]|nr:TonB-dependent receptor [Caulobacteraceae bacterium]
MSIASRPSGRAKSLLLVGVAVGTLVLSTPALAAEADAAAEATEAGTDTTVSEVVVTASTVNLLGRAETSSQGSVTKEEVDLRPVYRVGQLLETVPGLVVTAHSGEGKANQYLLRGFNLDHGTDLATVIDGMPVNMRTHAHGQGYTDLNFFIPELAGGIDFTKGPYYASIGDFGSVGSDTVRYLDALPKQASVSAGTVGDYRLFLGGSQAVGPGDLLLAGEMVHLDGPWDHPDNMHKYNALARYAVNKDMRAFSVTGMFYSGLWHSTTDQPTRAIEEGLISRFGTLDGSDGGQSKRYSLSANYTDSFGAWDLAANAYAIHYQLTLWNDFTHFLGDPINGDQHAQDDHRNIFGGAVSLTDNGHLWGRESKMVVGLQTRYDDIRVDFMHTRARTPLETLRDDKVKEYNLSAYVQNTTNWTPWMRSIIGAREDYFHGDDTNLLDASLSGVEGKSLFQPKGSLVFGPFHQTEFYVSGGIGFHSNDVRAGSNSDTGEIARPPFLVKSRASEIGVRTNIIPHLTAAVTLFQINFDSELIYDADAGQTVGGRPSHRTGVEFTGQYRPFSWLELSANIAETKARYTDASPPGEGTAIEDAPKFIASMGALVDNLGPWSGGIEFRDLGPHALVTADNIRSDGYKEWNMNVGYKLRPNLKLRVDVFNVFNSKDDAADYFYTTRLAGEPAEGIDDIQIHPLESRSFRFTVSEQF